MISPFFLRENGFPHLGNKAAVSPGFTGPEFSFTQTQGLGTEPRNYKGFIGVLLFCFRAIGFAFSKAKRSIPQIQT